MESDILYSINESTTTYEPSVPCIITRHKGFLTDEEFRPWMENALELFIEKKEEKGQMGWITDGSEADALSEQSLMWLAEDLNVRCFNSGLTHLALILPEDKYAMGGMNADIYCEESKAKSTDKIITQFFKDEESAKAWLREALSNEMINNQ